MTTSEPVIRPCDQASRMRAPGSSTGRETSLLTRKDPCFKKFGFKKILELFIMLGGKNCKPQNLYADFHPVGLSFCPCISFIIPRAMASRDWSMLSSSISPHWKTWRSIVGNYWVKKNVTMSYYWYGYASLKLSSRRGGAIPR